MTKGEIQAILFVAVSMLAGALVLLLKQFDADFLPDLGPAGADARAKAGIPALSAQTTGNAPAMTGLSSGAGPGIGDGKSPGEVPYSRTGAPGADAGYPVAGGPPESSSSGNDLQVPINTATASELQKLPGIGPTLAERIIAFRKQSGGFSTVEQLLEVKGIGPAKLDRMRPFVTLP